MCEWNRSVIIQDLVLAIVINTSATIIDGARLTTRGTPSPAWRWRPT